jgi:zinc/manganese transport system substrate-binding protein
MKSFIRGALALLFLTITLQAQAAIRILATTADWGALRPNSVASESTFTPRRPRCRTCIAWTQSRASLRARTADLVVANGAELEVGWLPVLLQEAGNSHPARPARLLRATSALALLEVPSRLDRAMGDIHPQGNPHVQLDPRNIAAVAKALTARLAEIDPPGADYYAARGADFGKRWNEAISRWQTEAAPLKDLPVVIMHRDQAYLCHWLGMKELASIEPKPGVPPSAGYLGELVTKLSATPPRLILLNAYNDPKAANWLSERVHAPAVVLPFSVGGSPGAKDLFGLYDDTIDKLLGAAK